MCSGLPIWPLQIGTIIQKEFMTGNLPRDFVLKEDFVNESEARRLIEYIQTIEFGNVQMYGVTARRRVAQFGWRYSFDTYQLTPAAPLCPELLVLRNRVAPLAGITADRFSEALVTEYPPGAGIGWHRDAPQFGIVAGISLGAECRMRFQRGEGSERITAAALLAPRSIYLLTGEARSLWQHMIPAVKAPRWSITFRTIRTGRAKQGI